MKSTVFLGPILAALVGTSSGSPLQEVTERDFNVSAPQMVTEHPIDGAPDNGLEKRDTSRVILCSNANRGGNCINWGMQTGHWWDFDDQQLAGVRDALSSIYPQDNTHKWSICSQSQGGGQCVINIVAPGIDNLQDFDFNDRAFSIRPFVL